jgi:hypothetical protein
MWSRFWSGWVKFRADTRSKVVKQKSVWETFNDHMREWDRKERESLPAPRYSGCRAFLMNILRQSWWYRILREQEAKEDRAPPPREETPTDPYDPASVPFMVG